jgi:hypothetical protein
VEEKNINGKYEKNYVYMYVGSTVATDFSYLQSLSTFTIPKQILIAPLEPACTVLEWCSPLSKLKTFNV